MRSTFKVYCCAVFLGCVAILLLIICLGHSNKHGRSAVTSETGVTNNLAATRYGAAKLAQLNALPSHRSVIDPVLVYSTFLGGSSYRPYAGVAQTATVIWVDGPGNIYVAGETVSKGFPVTPGVVQPQPQPAFLSKIDPTGQTLIFSTYIQGLASIAGIAVDGSGNIYLAGTPVGAGGVPLPSVGTPFQASPRSIGVLKLNSTATAILAATYLGGSGLDSVNGLAVDSSGLYIAGTTASNDFPTQNPLQASLGSSSNNAFVTKLDPTLSKLVYSTYLGENSSASGAGLAIDSSGDAYVVGGANSGFPTTSGAAQGSCSASDPSCSYMAKLNPSGSALLYSTYLANSLASAVAVDSAQNVYIAGLNVGPGFPQVNPVQPCTLTQTSSAGFISEINAAGSLVSSSCFESANFSNLALDSAGNVYTATSLSGSTPSIKNPIQANPGGPYILVINPATASVVFASYSGGAQQGEFESVALRGVGVDSAGNIYVAGYAYQLMPVFNALQPTLGPAAPCPDQPCYAGPGSNAFIQKIAPVDGAAAALSPGAVTFPAQQVGIASSPQTVTVIDLGGSPLTVSNVTVTPGDFSIQNNCATVSPAGGSCAIDVTYTPAAIGSSTATLTITDNSAGSPHTLALTGTGAIPALNVAPTTVSFGNQAVGVPSPTTQNVTLTNPGPLPLQIVHIGTSGDFSETNNCGTSINPGSNCVVALTFTPTATGNRTGALTITDNAPDSPQSAALSGTGGNPAIGLSLVPGSQSSVTILPGGTIQYFLDIGGEGMSGTASLSCTGAPAMASCSVPATQSVNASTPAQVIVDVTTTSHNRPMQARGFETSPWLSGFALLGVVFLPRLRSKRAVLRLLWFVPLIALVLCSCGGGGGSTQSYGTPSGTYTLTVTATLGSTTQSQNVTLIVQ
jgi:Abnormal spindle-like microcephaly-assoc'd, ASPM-SPD-2-Hydin/Beta-propeller repeat